MKYLPTETMLACRGVSSECKLAVDRELQAYHASPDALFQRQFQALPSGSRFYCSRIGAIARNYEFQGSPGIGRFITSLGITPDETGNNNPILTRTLTFKLGMEDDDFEHDVAEYDNVAAAFQIVRDFVRQRELMSLVGDHVWGLNIQLKDSIVWPDRNQMFHRAGLLQFTNLLRRVEHLKALKISQGTLNWERVKELIWEQSLPQLPHLTSLDLIDMQQESLALGFVRKYGSQLTHFSCMGSFLSSLPVSELNALFPNIHSFSVKSIDCCGLERLSKVKWALQKLYLPEAGRWKEPNDHVIVTVSKFAKTLVELRLLCLPSGLEIGDFGYFCAIALINDFRNLKKLVVSFLYTNGSWFNDFWCSKCRQLTELHIEHTNKDSDLMDTHIFLKAFERLPKLKRIIFWTQESNNQDEQIVSSIIHRPESTLQNT